MASNAGTLVRALDSNGDWTFGGGLSNYLTGNAAIGQQIKCALLQFVGNCFWDPQAGLNWPGLLGQRNNQAQLNLQVGSVILNVAGVTSLQQLSVSLDRVTRALSVTWSVTTVYSVYSGTFQASVPQSVGG